ncbi:MAG: trypsin-like peptidase domain-containing protein [Clostridia bacterium]|nr:trypsin-like peptidase domain-containing protein [Clostridia bacterium]
MEQNNNQNKRHKFSLKTVLVSVLIAALMGASLTGCGLSALYNEENETSSTDAPNNNTTTNIIVNKDDYTVVEAIAEKVTPSVVGIRTTAAVTNFFFGQSESTGEGSGIIYTKDGYIITNYHVISEAVESLSSKIEVFLHNDSTKAYQASVVGYNITYDLAVIKIKAQDLPAVEIGDSDSLRVGQFVAAIGNPGGLEYMSSVTYGIVSGLNRSVADNSQTKSKVTYIQTDAAINPGNSGGALVDINGKLIGVNSVKIVSESYEGMGFAIPVNKAVELCQRMIDKQYEPTAYVGIALSERYDANTLKMLGFPAGAVVQNVASDSPADKANIKRGDIITEFAGETITDYTVFTSTLSDCDPGQTVKITIYRAGKYYTTDITIGSENS